MVCCTIDITREITIICLMMNLVSLQFSTLLSNTFDPGFMVSVKCYGAGERMSRTNGLHAMQEIRAQKHRSLLAAFVWRLT
jgi:hypothetical protein